MIDLQLLQERQMKRAKKYLSVARRQALRQARVWLESGISYVEFWEGKLGSKSASAIKEEMPRKRAKTAPKKPLKAYVDNVAKTTRSNPLTENTRLHHRTARHH